MSERTRIRKIQVSKLFGIFDHEIPLNLDERITIIHGPNAYGKTVVLQMLEGLFSGRWDRLRRVPFGELVVEFEDGGVLRMRPAEQKTAKQKLHHATGLFRDLVCSYVPTRGRRPPPFRYNGSDTTDHASPDEFVERHLIPLVRPLVRAFIDTWQDAPSGEFGNLKDLFERYEEAKSIDDAIVRMEEPTWLKALRERLKLRLIHTQRLGDIGDRQPTVSKSSDEIARRIKSILATYASRSQELDSTFLDRLLQEGKATSLSLAALQKRLHQIDRTRAQLVTLGFLDQERETHKSPPKLDNAKLDVLSVYVDDTERKLGVFDNMARKVQLLIDAVNRRFKYKRMRVSKDEGFIFESIVDGERIPLTTLSSGEQHELVLLSELLFKVSPGTLVLIDEPEISLHLAWQQQFLGDLVEMAKLSSFDVLVATHSPGIINKRWDLTVELKGPDLGSDAR